MSHISKPCIYCVFISARKPLETYIYDMMIMELLWNPKPLEAPLSAPIIRTKLRKRRKDIATRSSLKSDLNGFLKGNFYILKEGVAPPIHLSFCKEENPRFVTASFFPQKHHIKICPRRQTQKHFLWLLLS